MNYVSWADAVRFANWLHNGEPTGTQDLTTTEDGSYFVNGIGEFSDGLLEDVVREPDATWVIPTENVEIPPSGPSRSIRWTATPSHFSVSC